MQVGEMNSAERKKRRDMEVCSTLRFFREAKVRVTVGIKQGYPLARGMSLPGVITTFSLISVIHHLKNQVLFMRTLFFFLVIISLSLSSCGGNKKESSKEGSESSADDGTTPSDNPAEALSEAMKNLSGGDGKVADPVDHRKLKDMLKENVNGFSRKDYSSQTAGSMGFNISSAEASYEKSDKRIQATIMDAAGAGLAFMSLAAWSTMQLDREDSNGWERTSTYKGYKSFEKYTRSSNSSELSLIVHDRFIVTINGYGVDMDEVKNFADDLDLGELKKLI